MLATGGSTTLKRRRLLRGEITYSAAKEREINVLHALGYWDQNRRYLEYLSERIYLIKGYRCAPSQLGFTR